MKKLCLKLLQFYKKHISAYFAFFGYRCKFYPTCSEYCMQAIEKYGAIKGIGLGVKRIIKCNPFSKGGYDPLK